MNYKFTILYSAIASSIIISCTAPPTEQEIPKIIDGALGSSGILTTDFGELEIPHEVKTRGGASLRIGKGGIVTHNYTDFSEHLLNAVKTICSTVWDEYHTPYFNYDGIRNFVHLRAVKVQNGVDDKTLLSSFKIQKTNKYILKDGIIEVEILAIPIFDRVDTIHKVVNINLNRMDGKWYGTLQNIEALENALIDTLKGEIEKNTDPLEVNVVLADV